VVGLLHGDDVLPSGGRPGEPEREVDRLGAAVHQEHGVEFGGEQFGEPFGEFDHRGVVEAGVGVEPLPLAVDGVTEGGVAVAEDGHVVEHVEVAAGLSVDQVLAPAALHARRCLVVVLLDGGEGVVAALQQLRFFA